MALNAIAVEYGTSDDRQWIPRGCDYFAQQLTAAGTAHEPVTSSGGHENQLGPRMETAMWPFF